MGSVVVKNPHSVLAALQTRPKQVEKIILPDRTSAEWEEVRQLAQKNRVKVLGPAGSKGKGGKKGRGPKHGRESSTEAHIRDKETLSIEQLFAEVSSTQKGLWLALDQVQDPHNLGAIFRTAAFFGVKGILMTADRSVGLTSTVYDTASGGVEHVPVSAESNLARALDYAKEQGLWILGSSEHANDEFYQVPLDRNWLLVLGNEEKGLRRLTQERCDVMCRVNPKGGVTSLNVSVAAGVLISRLA